MSSTLRQVIDLVARGELRISAHGYDELAEDGVRVRDVVVGIAKAVIVEDYPEYPRGPCVLVQQRDFQGQPIHVVWGVPRDALSLAVVVTAYRPDPDRWSRDFIKRKL